MIAGIGTDIVRIQRLTDPLIKKILSESEFKIYLSFSSEKRKKEFAAGRFAAKEALIKASGSFIPFDQIEVLLFQTVSHFSRNQLMIIFFLHLATLSFIFPFHTRKNTLQPLYL